MIDQIYDENWDWTGTWQKNTSAIVGQQVASRLKLWKGEWFLDTSDGTPYMQDILGFQSNYDLEIQSRILGTPNVVEITNYSSSINERALTVNATITTSFGSTDLTITL